MTRPESLSDTPGAAESPDGLPESVFGRANDEKTRARILVVDDEESIRSMMADILRMDGHEVTVASSGEEAIELSQQVAFDLTFVDLVMSSGLGGLEVLEGIRKRSPEADVVVVTGFATIEVAVESMRLGAADFVTKPFSNAHLRIVVSKAFERRRLIRAAEESEHYKRLSRQDGLTGLYNHRFFHQLIDSEVARATRFGHKVSLLILDLDRFKELNDSHGHLVGDQVLRQISDLIRNTCRKYDFAARYGGEEFAIISPGSDAAQAAVLAERIRERAAEAEFGSPASSVHLTLSIGIATIPGDAREKRELIELADRALYAAKHQGRDRVICAKDLA